MYVIVCIGIDFPLESGIRGGNRCHNRLAENRITKNYANRLINKHQLIFIYSFFQNVPKFFYEIYTKKSSIKSLSVCRTQLKRKIWQRVRFALNVTLIRARQTMYEYDQKGYEHRSKSVLFATQFSPLCIYIRIIYVYST